MPAISNLADHYKAMAVRALVSSRKFNFNFGGFVAWSHHVRLNSETARQYKKPSRVLILGPSMDSRHPGQHKSAGGSVLNLLQTTQRYSSYTFSGFVGIHILNNVVIPLATWSQSSSLAVSTIDSAFEHTRKVYRPSPVVEFGLVFIPLAVHVASGLLLRTYRFKSLYPQGIVKWHRQELQKNAATDLSYPRLRAIPTFGLSDVAASGYITAFCVIFHILMVRYLPWKYDVESSIAVVTRPLQKHPRIFYTFYYSLLSAGVFHIISGWGKWLKLTTTPRSILVKNALVTVVNFSWVAALVRVGCLQIPQMLSTQYDALYGLLFRRF